MRQVLVGMLLVVAAVQASAGVTGQVNPPNVPRPDWMLQPGTENHVKWVAEVMSRMRTVKAGMTRQDLLTVFKPQGGMSIMGSRQRYFVSRDCPYFKVEVSFQGEDGPEHEQDVIASISKPYVEPMVID